MRCALAGLDGHQHAAWDRLDQQPVIESAEQISDPLSRIAIEARVLVQRHLRHPSRNLLPALHRRGARWQVNARRLRGVPGIPLKRSWNTSQTLNRQFEGTFAAHRTAQW